MIKIYTKIGDQGKTTFFGCGLVQKDDPRIEAFGALDELNSVIGVTLCHIFDEKIKSLLIKVQNDLFQVGADLGGTKLNPNSMPRVKKEHIQELESHIDEMMDVLGMPQTFILPGGTPSSSYIHLCRATARRAERSLVTVSKTLNINPEIIRYVNRLSDFLFVLARQANKEVDIKEQQPIYKYFEKKENSFVDQKEDVDLRGE